MVASMAASLAQSALNSKYARRTATTLPPVRSPFAGDRAFAEGEHQTSGILKTVSWILRHALQNALLQVEWNGGFQLWKAE